MPALPRSFAAVALLMATQTACAHPRGPRTLGRYSKHPKIHYNKKGQAAPSPFVHLSGKAPLFLQLQKFNFVPMVRTRRTWILSSAGAPGPTPGNVPYGDSR